MIPILFAKNATTFTTNGLGRLSDALSCNVVEERNGKYELSMEYPIDGIHFNEIETSSIICAVPADGRGMQPFRVYKVEKLIKGKARIYAEHISYQARYIPVMPFTANSCVSAMAGLSTYAATSNPFTLWTDISKVGSYSQDVPESIRARLGGQSGSILDIYGGELEWDGYNIRLHSRRGQDSGVTLRYGKNITDLTQEKNITNTYTAVCPYYRASTDEECLTLPEKYITSDNAGNYPFIMAKSVDMSSEFEDGATVTVETLRAKTREYITKNNIGVPAVSIKVSFVALWQTEEYKNIAALERVNLCDTVTVIFEKLDVSATAKVVRTNYNVLKDRYDSIELGEAKSQLSGMIANQSTDIEAELTSHMQQAIAHATALIRGGLGGYVVMTPNPDTGYPEEILIMDKPNKEDAVRCIRMNKNGIGFSDNGYDGDFTTAWTIENRSGHFIADYIDAGKLNADLIQTGRIQALNDNGTPKSNNYWDMASGDFQLSSTTAVVENGYANSTIASKGTVSRAVNTYDSDLNYQAVFNKLTNNGRIKGITMDSANNALYINATYINTGTLEGITIKAGGRDNKDGTISVYDASDTLTGKWDKDGIDVKSGNITGATITGNTIQSATTGQRIVLDDSSSIRGKHNNTTHNIINMEQVVSGSHQLTIDADTQLNIRTPKLCVLESSKGEASYNAHVTATNLGSNAYMRVSNIEKVMPEYPEPGNPRGLEELRLKSTGDNDDLLVTLPVYLYVTWAKEERVHGMVITGATAPTDII